MNKYKYIFFEKTKNCLGLNNFSNVKENLLLWIEEWIGLNACSFLGQKEGLKI
jgi:hypothetical protein